MRKIHRQWFGGTGEDSVKELVKIKKRLNFAFSTLSGIQQPPRPCDPEDSLERYEKEVRIGEKEVRDIAEDIFCSLTGEEVKTTKKATRRNR